MRWMLSVVLALCACRQTRDDVSVDTDIDIDSGVGSAGSDAPETGGHNKYDLGSSDEFPIDDGAYKEVVLADPVPPPVSGGTLALSADGSRLFAADPDRDTVYVVDTTTSKKIRQIDLATGSEPGRVVEGPDGQIHVVLRRGGGIATIDPELGELVQVRPACARPRGIGVDGDGDVIVACGEGLVVRLGADGSHAAVDVGVELRDVVAVGPSVRVSTMRIPAVLTLGASGQVLDIQAPPTIANDGLDFEILSTTGVQSDHEGHLDVMAPNTARRTVAGPNGGWRMLHQVAATTRLASAPSGYGADGCIPAQTSVISYATAGDAEPQAWPLRHIAPAFDFAVSDDGSLGLVVGAVVSQWVVVVLHRDVSFTVVFDCRDPGTIPLPGEPTSVVLGADDRAWIQLREPAMIVGLAPRVDDTLTEIPLHARSVRDSGHDLFHRPTHAMIACVSCHPEGGDDGQRWPLTDDEVRRTQPLNVRLDGSEPLHWRGEMSNMAQIFQKVRIERMFGAKHSGAHSAALERFVFALPPDPIPYPDDVPAVIRGRAVFEDLGCVGCHDGDRLTTDESKMMGTFGVLQIPTLVGVALRPPYMHDARAATLDDAITEMLPFSVPGGDPTPDERADLVTYLESIQPPP